MNPDMHNIRSQFTDLDDNPAEVTCLLCDSTFTLPCKKDNFLSHLLNVHHLVIDNLKEIASLKSYIHFWRVRFRGQSLEQFCTKINYNTNSSDEPYYLLSDFLMEDKILRDEIFRAKLEWVLSVQEKEKSDTSFKRGCIFCRTSFSGSCTEYVKHLGEKHNFLLGKPNNLVFINELLDKVEKCVEKFVCIYCEKIFKNRNMLKEHMRKKMHKRINPFNKNYDKYYIQNYMKHKFSKNKDCEKDNENSHLQGQSNSTESQSSDNEDWSDWHNDDVNISCLICKYSNQKFEDIMDHMKSEHKFDFLNVTLKFNFYKKVKLVNYMRKQMLSDACIYCSEKIKFTDVVDHVTEKEHFTLLLQWLWDQSEFYCPILENDSFLYSLDTDTDSE